MRTLIFDIETDGLDPSKIHCLSYMDLDSGSDEVHTLSDYHDMRCLFDERPTLIGHNIVNYDVPVIERILNMSLEECDLIDTLPLSWYLYPKRMKHGLAPWGETLGVSKPEIDDWENLDQEDYEHRCVEDVKINSLLWDNLESYLDKLYPRDEQMAFFNYLNFKMKCLGNQEASKLKIDTEKADTLRDELEKLIWEKEEQLAVVMPKVPVTKTVNRPANLELKTGGLSVRGQIWRDTCEELGIDEDSCTSVEVTIGHDRANPNSTPQIKSWLFSLGWEPITFDYKKNKDGSDRKIPQVRIEGELCESVERLIQRNPAVDFLCGLTVLTHRKGIVKGIQDAVDKDGYLAARAGGLTNTLRFKHKKPIVNLPGTDKPYGKEIRELICCEDDEFFVGADMVSLEDTTKRHYMQPFDPDYVEEMSQQGFDPHLDLAKFAGAVSNEDIARGGPDVAAIRKQYKAANYACVYGVGELTLSRQIGIKPSECRKLIKAFWSRNAALEEAMEYIETKTIKVRKEYQKGNPILVNETWVKNPVSKFWYNLRHEKDRFSTINQSTGVYVFDTWLKNVMEFPVLQMHDEALWRLPEIWSEYCAGVEIYGDLEDAISKTNDELGLNVELKIDIKTGSNYAACH